MSIQMMPPVERSSVPASNYTFDQLADIYNQARVDYIVPMPMNGKRMAEYVKYYDVDLSGSSIALNANREETGIGMLGVRDDRGWVTRLGVIPERRGYKVGQFITELLLEQAQLRGVTRMQLEVISGNEPAHKLFQKIGFEDVRELTVIRRPPSVPQPNPDLDSATVTEIPHYDIPAYLDMRTGVFSWLDENRSLLNIGSLHGLQVELPSGENGWTIFQRAPFQLTHFAFSSGASTELIRCLLYHVHRTFPMQDTKIENLPANHPAWTAFESNGYFEVFRRIEMYYSFA